MSPEPIQRCASDSPKDLPINQVLQKAKCLKAIKSTDRVRKQRNDPNRPSGFIPSLPDPEPRSVAGHVSRESNRVRMAEAAPSNSSQPSSKQQQHPRKHRRKQGRRNASNDKDDGSDSDSEHHDDGSDKDPTQSRRGLIQNQHDEDEAIDDMSSTALLKEESERVRLLQTLTKVGSEWERVRPLREHNQESGARRVKQLIRRYGNGMNSGAVTEMTSPMVDNLAILDEEKNRRQEYLDDALCRHLEDKSQNPDDDGPVEASEHSEELIQQTELGFIRRCVRFDPHARDAIPPEPQLRLVRIVANLYLATMDYLSAEAQDSERNYQDDLVAGRRFIKRKHNEFEYFQGEIEIVQLVIGSYFAAMAEEVSKEVVLDMWEGQRRRHCDLGDTLKVCERIHNSRHSGCITPEYSAWASSRLDPAKKSAIFLEWNRHKQQETLATFRRLMDSAKMSFRQEFCSDIATPGVVSLVLFKENWPSAVKDVTPGHLRNMGWVLEEHKSCNQFVRLEVRTDAQEGQKHIFKVSMDDEVLAILALDGTRWIYWDEKDFPQRNKQHRLAFI